MKLILLFTFAAVATFAQTNTISTNSTITTNAPIAKRPSVHVVTLAEVQAGLTTISNKIAKLEIEDVAAKKKLQDALNNLRLTMAAGKISPGDAYTMDQQMRFHPAYLDIDRAIAELKLQDATIRQRYKYLLEPSVK